MTISELRFKIGIMIGYIFNLLNDPVIRLGLLVKMSKVIPLYVANLALGKKCKVCTQS